MTHRIICVKGEVQRLQNLFFFFWLLMAKGLESEKLVKIKDSNKKIVNLDRKGNFCIK